MRYLKSYTAPDGSILFNGRQVRYIFLDEVHERNLAIDLLLWKLREMVKHTDIKLVLMSATANAEVFSKYFEIVVKKVYKDVIRVKHRAYPIEDIYLNDIPNQKSRFSEETKSLAAKVVKLVKRLILPHACEFFSDISQSLGIKSHVLCYAALLFVGLTREGSRIP